MSKEASETIKVLLGGIVIGTAIGVLFAPGKGSKTRKKLRKKFDQGKTILTEETEKITETLKTSAEEVKEKFEKTVIDLMDKGKDKTEELIHILEEKLNILKENMEKKP